MKKRKQRSNWRISDPAQRTELRNLPHERNNALIAEVIRQERVRQERARQRLRRLFGPT